MKHPPKMSWKRNCPTISLLLLMIVFGCSKDQNFSSIDPVNWAKRSITISETDSLIDGTTYLSVYSQIYSMTEHRTHDLTVTVSMRNTNLSDTIYINKAVYYNTKGDPIRTYFNKTIFIGPMETVEIVIDEKDKEGGTGANFLFDWAVRQGNDQPLFEGVMISTSGSQGLSFTTQGKQIN